MMKRLTTGQWTLRDMREQFQAVLKMGPLGNIMNQFPGMSGLDFHESGTPPPLVLTLTLTRAVRPRPVVRVRVRLRPWLGLGSAYLWLGLGSASTPSGGLASIA